MTDTPSDARGVWILTCLFGVPAAVGLGLGIDWAIAGEWVSAAGFGIAALTGPLTRITLCRYRITVSDDQVRVQRLFRPLVRPIDVTAPREDLLGYYAEQYRGITFSIYRKDGTRVGCVIRTYTIPVPEIREAMARHGIPPCGPRGKPLS